MLTNNTGLPRPIFDALAADDYDAGISDITATGLLNPPRKAYLERLYPESRDEDVADMGRLMLGKALHAALARHGPNHLSDRERLYMAVLGWTVGGQTDLVDFENDEILDYKSILLAEWRRGLREERAQQLNIYAQLLRANGYTVNKLTAVCFVVDFSKVRAVYEQPYPEREIVAIDVPLWSDAEAQDFIRERVAAHQGVSCDTLCTDDERWITSTWAVKKDAAATRAMNGASRFESEDEARAFVAASKPGEYDIEQRVGPPNRCLHYCGPGRIGVCEQFNQWNSERLES